MTSAKHDDERLLQQVYDAESDLKDLAAAFDLSLEGLAQWASGRRVQQALHGLRVLADVRTQLILSRYRLTAAAKLLELAGGEAGELARKACVDLLKLDLVRAAAPAGDAGDAPVIDPSQVLAALERLGPSTDEADTTAP